MKYIKISPSDNVAVALADLRRGEEVEGISLVCDVPQGHKVALCDIAEGENVIKYGFPIGHATRGVKAGEWINETILKTNLSGIDDNGAKPWAEPQKAQCSASPLANKTWRGYKRANGRAGVRNEIWILPTVGCVNSTAQRLAAMMERETDCGDIDGVHAFTHNYGCSQLGDDHENTRRILADLVHHPNAGGVLVLGLGCENNQIDALRDLIGDYDPERVKFMECQKVSDEIESGMALLREIYSVVRCDKREDVPISQLAIGLKCGGSDGLSGITANPLVGRVADAVIDAGGSAVLTEVPEMFGSEQILFDRCTTADVHARAQEMIRSFKQYFIDHHQPVSENPSPGNKRGGISTLEEKSLGCTQKSGSSLVRDVLCYGDRVSEQGLSLLWGPGNDIVATTALAAAGCQLILFTTGRGTPLGSLVPTIKISTNNALAANKPQWIDFNAGEIAEGMAMDVAAERLAELVLEVASGKLARNEQTGSRDMAIFKSGVTL